MEYEIDGVKIPLHDDWNRIAISLSGGADSALLTWLLCSIIKEVNPKISIHIISHIRMWKTRPWQEYDSNKVYDYVSTKFNFFNWHRHTNFIAPDVEYGNMGPTIEDEYGKMVSGDNAQIRSFSEYVCHYNKIDAYYNAVTRNPKINSIVGMKERDIDPTEDNKHLRLMKHMNGYAVHPFRFVEKSWVVKQYKRLGLMNLFNITRSCEGEFSNLTYHSYRKGDKVPICGECFWCKERNWAIAEIFKS
jgi:hypothetical protein